MKLFVLLLLAVVSSGLAAPKKDKRDAEFFGQFTLPEIPVFKAEGEVGGEYDHRAVDHEYGPPHEEYGPPHEEYGPPHEEYGPPHEEYGPPRREETTTPHYCPEEDFQAAFIQSPPDIPTFPLPEVAVVRKVVQEAPHHEYGPPHEEYGPPHEEYGPPHEEYGPPTTVPPTVPPTVPTVRYYPYPAPTTLPPPPPPTARTYPYPPPTTVPPPPPPTARTYPYPPPTAPPTPPPTARTYPYPPPTAPPTYPPTARTYPYPPPTTTVPPPPEPKISTYAGSVYSKYEHTYHHEPAVVAPVIRYVKPKIVIHKKVLTFPLLKKKFFKFGK